MKDSELHEAALQVALDKLQADFEVMKSRAEQAESKLRATLLAERQVADIKFEMNKAGMWHTDCGCQQKFGRISQILYPTVQTER